MNASDFKAARTRLGLTQTAMGKLLGVTKRQVGSMERGAAPIRHAYAMLIKAAENEPSAPGATGSNERN